MRDPLALLRGWVLRNLDAEPSAWFDRTLRAIREDASERELGRAVGLARRRLGKADLALTPQDLKEANQVRTGFDPTGLSVDQAARIAFLLAAAKADEEAFPGRLGELYRTAELSESIAYLRGLAVFPAPRALLGVASQGVRSAVQPVFEAVAHRNPYPAEFFDQGAWNQMVLKALFIGASLGPIQGLAERVNPELAQVLVHYAHERWAADRSVSHELWLCVGPFAHGDMLHDLERVLTMGTAEEREAARVALQASPDERASEVLARAR